MTLSGLCEFTWSSPRVPGVRPVPPSTVGLLAKSPDHPSWINRSILTVVGSSPAPLEAGRVGHAAFHQLGKRPTPATGPQTCRRLLEAVLPSNTHHKPMRTTLNVMGLGPRGPESTISEFPGPFM